MPIIMMEVHVEQKSLFTYGVDLDQGIRADKLLGRITKMVDFSFVRDDVCELYDRQLGAVFFSIDATPRSDWFGL